MCFFNAENPVHLVQTCFAREISNAIVRETLYEEERYWMYGIELRHLIFKELQQLYWVFTKKLLNPRHSAPLSVQSGTTSESLSSEAPTRWLSPLL